MNADLAMYVFDAVCLCIYMPAIDRSRSDCRYQGVMRMVAAMLQPANSILNGYVLGKKGIFGVTMMLPAYCIMYLDLLQPMQTS